MSKSFLNQALSIIAIALEPTVGPCKSRSYCDGISHFCCI